MIKKITLTLLLCCIIISCGKKGNPKYENTTKKFKIQTTLIKKV
jgi:hypothetical protein